MQRTLRKRLTVIPTLANLRAHLTAEATCDSNDFRKERLYNAEADAALRSFRRALSYLFKAYGGDQKRDGMSRAEWLRFCEDTRLIDKDFTQREARLVFAWSKMTVVDDVACRKRAGELTFVDFLEALGRCADMRSVPTDADLGAYGLQASEIARYEHLLIEEGDTAKLDERRPSSEWGAPKTRPLAEKVFKLIALILGRLDKDQDGDVDASDFKIRD